VLNGQPTAQKCDGGYETKLFRRMNDFIAPNRRNEDAATAFRLFVLNCALRNGDAHLKSFAVIHDDPLGETARLAPVYDAVTNSRYREVGKRMLAAWQQGIAESLEPQGGIAP
jgi:serine/threonine-protein kinase HipA